MLLRSNAGADEIFVAIHTGPDAHPVSCMIDAGSLDRGVKQPGRGVNHQPPSSAEVKERVELCLILEAFMARSRVNLFKRKICSYTLHEAV